MTKHRAQAVRPRYGRISVLTTALAVTAVAVLGASGTLSGTQTATPSGADGTTRRSDQQTGAAPVPAPPAVPTPADSGAEAEVARRAAVARTAPEALPPGSGQGRRIVFSQSRQRVWLVGGAGGVARTYPVSGSLEDNLDPGTYTVYSRSEDAVGIDDSGTMRHFVRFTQGPSGAAIGFHDIPVSDGARVQSVAALGTPRSHGCIRQRGVDARALWAFAPLGTTVVVTP